MSTDDLMREQPPRRIEPEQAKKPDTEAEAAEVAGTPDAVKQATARRDAVRERMDQVRGRGVEWVRPTDLLVRSSGTLAGRGIEFNSEQGRRSPLVPRHGGAVGVGAGEAVAAVVGVRSSRPARRGSGTVRGRDEVTGW